MPQPVPPGFHTVTPHLVVKGASAAIEFYKKAFGAREISRAPVPGKDTLMHADIMIGNSHVMLTDEAPAWGALGPLARGGSSVCLHVYVENVDAFFAQAVAAGAKVIMPPTEMFWGDRYSKVADPFGHEWSIASHVEDVSPADMEKRAVAMFSSFAGEGCPAT